MIISPFTPLFFHDAGKAPVDGDGIESRHVQTFSREDSILIECVCSVGEAQPVIYVVQEGTGNSWQISNRSFAVNESAVLYFTILRGLANGVYHVTESSHNLCSRSFRVTDDTTLLARTTLIQYSMFDNRQRTDTLFLIDGMRYFFDFRVPGGFKAGEVTFGCENEQFTTQQGDICTLWSIDTVQKKFTMGGQGGVPVWFAELLNRLLTCTYVYFDGVRYERKDGSVPEVNIQMEGLDSFVYKVMLQKVTHLNPAIENENLVILRRKGGDTYMKANNKNRLTY